MVKSEIVKQLHRKHPTLNRSHIETIVDIMFNTIADSLIKHEHIELRKEYGHWEGDLVIGKDPKSVIGTIV